MHGSGIGINQSPVVAASYMCVTAVLFLCGKFATVEAAAPESMEHSAGIGSAELAVE
jgi:hypothetical protein